MDPRCLQHLITAEQRRHFEERGFLIVPQVLDEAQRTAVEEGLSPGLRALSSPS
jgi:hypothetical protein